MGCPEHPLSQAGQSRLSLSYPRCSGPSSILVAPRLPLQCVRVSGPVEPGTGPSSPAAASAEQGGKIPLYLLEVALVPRGHRWPLLRGHVAAACPGCGAAPLCAGLGTRTRETSDLPWACSQPFSRENLLRELIWLKPLFVVCFGFLLRSGLLHVRDGRSVLDW